MSSSIHDRRANRAYSLRRYRSSDRESFLSLYETVFGQHPGTDWFEWKYESNPYFDGVPMVVAEVENELVGAVPLFAQRMRVGSRDVRTFQPADVMVHPNHRRQGLFTRLIERSYEAFRSDEPTLLIGFPNDAALPGWLKTGWEIVASVPTYYRIQSPGSLLGLDSDRLPTSVIESAAAVAAQGYFGIRDGLAESGAADVSVERYGSIPTEVLASLSRTEQPEGFYGKRDERFYAWRFSNPNWEYATYVASRDGLPVAAVVTGTRSDGSLTRLAEILPLTPVPEEFRPLLRRVLEDHASVDAIAAPARDGLRDCFESHGFYSDTEFPLSKVSETRTLISRRLPSDGKSANSLYGTEMLDESNWRLSFADADNS